MLRIVTLAVVSLGWIGIGYFLGRLSRVRRRNSPIGEIEGIGFPWEVEVVASRVLLGLLSDKTFLAERERRLLLKKARQIQVQFAQELPIAGTWSVHRGGFLVRLKRGDVWRARFAQAFAHALHLVVRGEPDPLRKDAAWFELAKRYMVHAESDRPEAETLARDGDEAGSVEHGDPP